MQSSTNEGAQRTSENKYKAIGNMVLLPTYFGVLSYTNYMNQSKGSTTNRLTTHNPAAHPLCFTLKSEASCQPVFLTTLLAKSDGIQSTFLTEK